MSLYSFHDTTGAAADSGYPAEAMLFNGTYIEDQIAGYRTLSVSGRENISVNLTDTSVGNMDGSIYMRKRYTPRTITVNYQLLCASPEAFRRAYNKLNEILDAEQAQVIFADEPDKFFTATKSKIASVDSGVNNVIGSFDLYCTDPFKYSTEVFTAEANTDGVIAIDYDGTYKAYPTLTADVKSELGFVGYIKDDGSALQIGDPDEVDGATYNFSQYLMADPFGNGLPSDWAATTEACLCLDEGQTKEQTGTAGKIAAYSGTGATDYGSGSAWHGAAIARTVPADQSGVVGAVNCTCEAQVFITTGNVNNVGSFELDLTGYNDDGSKYNIAAMEFIKSTQANNKMTVKLWVNGKKQYSEEFEVVWSNWYTGDGYGRVKIEKFGNEVTFSLGDKTHSFVCAEIATAKVREVSVYFSQYGTKPAVAANVLRALWFATHAVDSWVDIPNKLKNGDVVVADCGKMAIKVNAVDMASLGAIGNDWEDFCLAKGTNTVKCLYSDWATTEPTFSMQYRKVYL